METRCAADAHDAGLVGGRGKPAKQLVLVMLGWSGAVGNRHAGQLMLMMLGWSGAVGNLLGR